MQGGERFRGSSDVPLTNEGVANAVRLASRFAQRGGLDEIMTSNLGRTVHTSQILSHYTHAPITYIGDGLHPWHLGSLEGQEVTPERLALQNHLIQQAPNESLSGRGPISTADGESFNSFKQRTLNFLQGVINRSASQPDRRIGLVTHYRVKKLLDAWMRKGADPSGTIDSDDMVTHSNDNTPGAVERLVLNPYSGLEMHSVDMIQPGQLQGGMYLIRHESTPWNSSTPTS